MLKAMLRMLLLTLAVLCCIFTSSCSENKRSDIDVTDGEIPPNDDGVDTGDTVIDIPASENFGRNVISFGEIIYERPDTDALSAAITEVTSLIRANQKDYNEQLEAISVLESDYSAFLTMYAYANVAISRNSADGTAVAEYEHLSTAYPKIIQGVEDMMVAAANSPHAKNFEDDYFGDGLIEKYARGGMYTDRLVALLEKEAILESEFASLSTASVEITYEGVTDTFENIKISLREKYGDGTLSYDAEIKICEQLYEKALEEKSSDILVELFKARSLIADECDYESYSEYAYKHIYHDYSPKEIDDFLNDISAYALPIYRTLANHAFYDYFRTHKAQKLNYAHVVNTLGELYAEIDTGLSEAYSYMLHYGYFDVANKSDNRADGAFTVYFDDYDTPFIFMTAEGSYADYMTLSHEFGHFYDSFLNYDEPASMDLLEVSSQGLELLTLSRLRSKINAEEYKYLYYHEMQNALLTLIFQGFYAKFEHKAYELDYNEITKERLSELVAEAAREMGLNNEHFSSLSSVAIPHVVLYPFYVQSYCTSLISALDIFFLEEDEAGDGVSAYKSLLSRDGDSISFAEKLEDADLESPFARDRVKKIVDRIHFSIMGYHYFIQSGDSNAA